MNKPKKRCILFYILIMVCSTKALAQNRDSLKTFIETADDDTLKVDALLKLAQNFYLSAPEEAIAHTTKAIQLSEALGYRKGLAYGYKNIGLAYYFQGKYFETIDYWQRSLNIFREIGDKVGVANLLSNLGAVNNNEGDDTKALELYLESLRVSEEINDSLRIVTALINIGLVYQKKPAMYDVALDHYIRAISMSEAIKYDDAVGTASLNAGEIYFERGDDSTALRYFEKSLQALEASGNVFYSLNFIGQVYAKRGDFETAIRYQTESYEKAKKVNARLDMARSLLGLSKTFKLMDNQKMVLQSLSEAKSIAEEIGATFELRDSYAGLAASSAQTKNYRNAYEYQVQLTDIKDTLFRISNEKKLGLIQLNYDIDKKQSEIDLLTKDKELQELALQKQRFAKNAMLAGLILILIIAFIILRNYLAKVKINKILDRQKEEIESLLLNILPQKIAKELRLHGSAKPRNYENVSVLFTDFKDFTKISAKLSPEELVEKLNQFFVAFDNIIEKYNLEKIKTIGDAYMCAGGLPAVNDTHPYDTVRAALEMQDYMHQSNLQLNGGDTWELRVGIHTGPIMAGVVGKKKYAYDIWGSTVNVASRMESNGEPGKVNISAATNNLVKDRFSCLYRGKIKAKNVGEIDMYFVENEINIENKP